MFMLPRCLKTICYTFLQYYNNYDDFILFRFESVERTVDIEPVNIVVVPEKTNNDQTNLCDKMMKIYHENYFYRKFSPIRFFRPSSQIRSPT